LPEDPDDGEPVGWRNLVPIVAREAQAAEQRLERAGRFARPGAVAIALDQQAGDIRRLRRRRREAQRQLGIARARKGGAEHQRDRAAVIRSTTPSTALAFGVAMMKRSSIRRLRCIPISLPLWSIGRYSP